MSSEAGPLRWYGQKFEGVALPQSGGGVGEEARLRAAPIGVYEMVFRQQPRYEFSGALIFNSAGPQASGCEGQWQFEASEDLAGSERTLMIQSTGGELPFESLEITPLDWEERPLNFTRVEVGARRSTIRYGKDAPPESLKISFSGIDVLDVETVAACLWVHGKQHLPEPLAALITREDEIRVDRLCNPTGEARKLEGHLLALFAVLPGKTSGRLCGLECMYQYPLAPGGPAASIPVTRIPPMDFSNDAALSSSLAAGLTDWHLTARMAAGAFVFEVTIYGTQSQRPTPALHLTRLLLSTEAIADWE